MLPFLGLGTRVPWDEQFVIESLSDSTIYMAYYTVAHMLQGPDNFDGTKVGPAGITADQLTDAVWDYIFKQGAYPDGCTIPEATLQTLRREFEYWYPLDLRVSGKDLVRNHLTMALYNHAAIWPDQPDKWPRGYFTNGHVGVDGEKMSKQLGNFITAYGAMATNNVHFNQKEGKWKSQSWSTDTVRLALANAGDTMSDANFKSDIADKEILGLLNELDWIRENLAAAEAGQLRTGDKLTVEDQVFHIAMDRCINEADQMYEAMKFSLAVKACYYDLMNARNTYRSYFALSGGQMHEALVRRYVDTFIVMLSPICTHICEYIWRDVLGRNGSVTRAPWPTLSGQDHACLQMSNFVQQTLARFTKQLFGKKKKKKKSKKNAGQDTATADLPPTHGIIYVQPEYPEWKQIVMKWVDAQWDDSIEGGLDKKAVMKGVGPAFQDNEVVKAAGKTVNKFLGYLVSNECRKRGRAALQTQPPFDEMAVLQEQTAYLRGSLRLSGGLQIVRVGDPAAPVPAEPRILENAEPGNPVLWAYRG